MKRGEIIHKKVDWSIIIKKIRRLPPHHEIKIGKNAVIHPLKAGFRIDSYAIPKGERRNYRICMRNGRSIHVREYSNCYGIHWDRYDPQRSFIKHLILDSPVVPLVLSSIFFILLIRFVAGKYRLFRFLKG